MSTANSGLNCSNTKEEVTASVLIKCPSTNNNATYSQRLGTSYNYTEYVYNEVQGITL